METEEYLKRLVAKIGEGQFEQFALEVFHHQAVHCSIYAEYLRLLRIDIRSVSSLNTIPFLPIQLFKNNQIVSGNVNEEAVFTSSSTTGTGVSKHFVKSLDIYRWSFEEAFRLFYGDPAEWTILALLPSYLERQGSSLVYMADALIKSSQSALSGFFLHDFEQLKNSLTQAADKKEKVLLLGVTFALLDFAEVSGPLAPEVVVMETGGMKGRKEEMIREEVHAILKEAFSVSSIHSEYGMTELLSQAYSKGDGLFQCPPWMRILVRETSDPLHTGLIEKTGGVNVIDLANIHSCSFIATQDLGLVHEDGSFEIKGRFDHADVRGCNLMALK